MVTHDKRPHSETQADEENGYPWYQPRRMRHQQDSEEVNQSPDRVRGRRG
jgi:hypothetical protein